MYNLKKEFNKQQLGILLKKYKYWNLYLSPKQYYLGKLRIVLNRKEVVDLCDLKNKESAELFRIIKESKKAIIKCFNPDLFNYATLGNHVRQHNWHVIPRYKEKRIVNDIEFKDDYWNDPPWPESAKYIDKETMEEIYKFIFRELKNHNKP